MDSSTIDTGDQPLLRQGMRGDGRKYSSSSPRVTGHPTYYSTTLARVCRPDHQHFASPTPPIVTCGNLLAKTGRSLRLPS